MRNQDTNRTEFTAGQLAIAKALESLGYVTDLEQYFAPYTADIMLRNIWVIVEYDKSHSFKKKDKKRDDFFMEKYKMPTLRIKDIPKKEELDKLLLDFIAKWEPSAEECKRVMWNI